MNKITVIGSLNMDLAITTSRIPVIGETILGDGFITVPGGKGANQAVAAARLGGDVTMVGCVGCDLFGINLKENLSGNGVNIENIRVVRGYSTGVAVIVVKDGDNCIIVDSGANASLLPQDIIKLESLIQDSFIVVIQLEIPQETVETAIDIARKHGVKVLLNPAPARELSYEFLSKVDILTPNESECGIIIGHPVRNISDAKEAVLYLNGKGISTVIVTMGGNGVVYNDCNQIIHKAAPEVEVVDTTAAGDSFSGAIAVALANGMDMNAAINFANTVGALTVTRKGAQSSLPTLKEVMNFCNSKEV